jgi:transposase
MGEVITIGVDLAKNVFQVHGIDAAGAVIVRRQLRRGQVLPVFKKLLPCLVGMEAWQIRGQANPGMQYLIHSGRLYN